MASRVNKKFVTLLVAVLVLLSAGVLAAITLLQNRPEQQRARARELFKEGKIAEALDQWDLALRKRSSDFEMVTEFLAALKQFRTDDGQAAGMRYQQLRAWTRQAHSLRPADTQIFLDMMRLYMRVAQFAPGIGRWNEFYDLTSHYLNAMASDNPNRSVAQKYRGIAQTRRMESLDLPQPERDTAKQDLLAAQAVFPDDGEVSFYLAYWAVLAARDAERVSGRPEEITGLRDEAVRLTQAFLDQHPDDLQAQLWHARVLASTNHTEEAAALLDRIEAFVLRQPPDTSSILTVVALLSAVDRTPLQESPEAPPTTRGLVRASDVLVAALERAPDDVQLRLQLGTLYRNRVRTAEALETFRDLRQRHVEGDILDALMFEGVKSLATFYYANLMLTEAVRGPTEEARTAALKESEPIVAEYARASPDTPQSKLLSGKLALIQGNYTDAVKLLEESNAATADQDVETLLLIAGASQQLGQFGEAVRCLETALQLNGTLKEPRTSLVRLYLRTRQTEPAQTHLDKLLSDDPKDATAVQLQAVLRVQQERFDDAISIYQGLDPENNRGPRLAIAQCHILANRPEEARKILQAQFSRDPKDLLALQLLVGISSDPQQIQSLVRQAREAGAEQAALDLLLAQTAGPQKAAEALEGLIEEHKSENPLAYRLQRYQLFRQQNKTAEAAAELAQAATLDPKHPLVVQEQFKQALADKNWSAAEELAQRAAELNLDKAQGQFFYGQMYGARGEPAQAAVSFRRGLEARPVYSDGWLLLGEALRGSGDFEAARDAYRRATEQQPTNTRAWSGLAAVAASRGEAAAAVSALEQALRYSPNEVTLKLQYLAYLEQQGEKQQALAQRRELASQKPQVYDNRRALAVLEAELGEGQAATATAEQLLKDEGSTRQNLGMAAQVYATTGQLPKARELLQGYIEGLGDKAKTEDWMLVGQFLVGIGALDNAAGAYQEAMALEDPQQRQATRQFADTLFNLRGFAQAGELYQRLHAQFPDDRRVTLRLAESLARQGKFDEADALVGEYVKANGEEPGTLLLAGNLAQNRAAQARAVGQEQQAQEMRKKALLSYNRAIELAPKAAVGYYSRATLLQEDPDGEAAAMADLAQALRLDTNLSLARQLLATIHERRKESGEARNDLRLLLERDPSNTAARLQLARILLKAGDLDGLSKHLDESLAILPGDPSWLRWKAQVASMQKKPLEASEYLRKSFTMAPGPAPLAELVDYLLQNKQPEDALKTLTEQQEMVTGQPLLEALRGQALAASGQSAAAQAAFTRALELSFEVPQIAAVGQRMVAAWGLDKAVSALEAAAIGTKTTPVQVVIAQFQLNGGHSDDAAQRLEKLVTALPSDSPLRYPVQRLLSVALANSGQKPQAIEVLRQLLQRTPESPQILNDLAFMLADDLDQASEALPLAQKAAELAPRDSQILDTLGWTQFKAGLNSQAAVTLQQALALNPTGYTAYHLAVVLRDLNQIDSARDQLQNAKVLAQTERDQPLLDKIQQQIEALDGPGAEAVP